MNYKHPCIEDIKKIEELVDGGRNALEQYADRHIVVRDRQIVDSGSHYQLLYKWMFDKGKDEEESRMFYVPPKDRWNA